MPLIKSGSKKALKSNIETEMKSNPGKENRAQNLAIAFSVQRKNRKKMAKGGLLTEERATSEDAGTSEEMNMEKESPTDPKSIHEENIQENEADKLASGGMEDGEAEMHDSLSDAIMAKRRLRKKLAEGGMVDLEKNSEESLNNEDDMSFEAGGREQFDDSQLSAQPEDSNEHGHDLSDEDEHDMVDTIRKKMKAKGRI